MIFKNVRFFLSVSVSAILAIFTVMSCSINFNEHYDKIDADKVRPISYKIVNESLFSQNYYTDSPETAPGDIVRLDVFFTGKRISFDDIEWSACWNIYTDLYGNLAPRGESELKLIGSPIIKDSMGGQIVRIYFQIPENILEKSDAIPNDLGAFSKTYQLGDMAGLPKTKKEALAYLENLAKDETLQNKIPPDLGIKIDGLAQIFSCMYEIYLDILDVPRTKIRHTARYHGKLVNIFPPRYYNIGINRNPILTVLDFYQGGIKIGNGLNDGSAIKFSLSKNRSAKVNIGVLYATNADRFFTLDSAFSSSPEPTDEKYGLRVFFSDSIYGKIELKNGNLINIAAFEAGDNLTQDIIIHRDKLKVGDKGWIWIMVYDECYGVANFPQGRSIVGVEIEFVE